MYYRYSECHYASCHCAECHNAECHYAKCHYVEYHYAECHYAECCGAVNKSMTFETFCQTSKTPGIVSVLVAHMAMFADQSHKHFTTVNYDCKKQADLIGT